MNDIYDNLKICVASNGEYLGAHIGAIPENTFSFVPTRPSDNRDTWDFIEELWVPFVPEPDPIPREAIIASPNGTAFKIMVDDDGTLATEPVT
jgi:hypothetical protein